MKMIICSPHHRMQAVAFAVALLAVPTSSFSQSWDGGDVSSLSWGSANNWNPNGVPAFNSTTDLIFNNLTKSDNNIGAARTVRSISYGASMTSDFITNTRNFASGGGTAAAVLTFEAASGNATLSVDAAASGNLTLGWSGSGTAGGRVNLESNLDIVHNGSGNLAFNRGISGDSGFTKTGTGTWIVAGFPTNTFTGAANFNQGRSIFGTTNNTAGAGGGDLNSASAVNLGGGTLEIRTTTALNKSVTPNTTVSAASTLVYNNSAATDQSLTVSTGTMVLDADLTAANISTSVAGNNIFNITRSITGNGDLIVKTYNDVSTSGANFSLGRVQLSGGGNAAWAGNLVVAEGTAQLSGADAMGSGTIILGETGNAFGAGLALNTSSGVDVIYDNDIIVRTGGFRAIKNNTGTSGNTTLSGGVTLEENLTIDHNLLNDGQTLTFSGEISGSGGLTVTRSIENNGSHVVLSGTNTYGGATTVISGSLTLEGSVTSNVSVDGTSRIGGDGTINANLELDAGAEFVFSLTDTLDVTGTVSLDSSFGVASLVNADGSAVDWTGVGNGTYTLIGVTASDFSGITNFGFGDAFDLGDSRSAYFTNGSLSLVVVPEPATGVLVMGALGLVVILRRRFQ